MRDNPVVEPGLSWLNALVRRQQPFLERVEKRLLKECKTCSRADPNNDRQTDEDEAAQFSSIFSSFQKAFFHTPLSPLVSPGFEAQL